MARSSELESLLNKKRNAIIGKWLELIANAHPAKGNLFRDSDQFTNPIGYTISSEVEPLVDEFLCGNTKSEKVAHSLDRIVRITAVQEFTPSQAIGFIFLLKDAVRVELGRQMKDQHLDELLEIYKRVDELAFTAFDMYASCRERIMEIRVNQVKGEKEDAFRLLERMLLKHEALEDAASSGYNNTK